LLVAREGSGKVIAEMPIANVRRIESTVPEVRLRPPAHSSAGCAALMPVVAMVPQRYRGTLFLAGGPHLR